jgi:hypothetical protein
MDPPDRLPTTALSSRAGRPLIFLPPHAVLPISQRSNTDNLSGSSSSGAKTKHSVAGIPGDIRDSLRDLQDVYNEELDGGSDISSEGEFDGAEETEGEGYETKGEEAEISMPEGTEGEKQVRGAENVDTGREN